MIYVAASVIGFKVSVLGWIVGVICNAYMGLWQPSLDVRGQLSLDITIITRGIEVVLCDSLCLLGAFLIYKEWRDGTFNTPLIDSDSFDNDTNDENQNTF